MNLQPVQQTGSSRDSAVHSWLNIGSTSHKLGICTLDEAAVGQTRQKTTPRSQQTRKRPAGCGESHAQYPSTWTRHEIRGESRTQETLKSGDESKHPSPVEASQAMGLLTATQRQWAGCGNSPFFIQPSRNDQLPPDQPLERLSRGTLNDVREW